MLLPCAVACVSAASHLTYRHSRERGNPVPFVRERLKSLDSRIRGNDGLEGPR
ncbi:hypothetical protein LG3211_0199 [Lysobacter gummosus]|nr:hypothetical protein LG3211_0199 [Lysobacter gummosus]